MKRKQLIHKYLNFFKSKGHKIIPSAPLIPENDPTVLFTTAGMHPLVPFLLGQPHPLGKKLCDIQKCIRTGDIEEVGDTTHHTFFEMLGNWSLGDYFKKQAIEMSFEFLTKELKIPKEKLAVTVFNGDKDAPKDKEAAKIWINLGIPKERIAFMSKKDNWWGPAGNTGPCGPDTEMFYWKSNNTPPPKVFDPENDNWVEIWNDVLMQYNKNDKGEYQEAKQKNIDTGMGVERTLAILNNLEDNYLTEVWKPIMEKIEELSNKKYGKNKEETKAMRIIADHIKAAIFILAEKIEPSNSEQGYVLRRLIRRAVRYGRNLNLEKFALELVKPIIDIYKEDYPELKKNENFIREQLEREEKKFESTLEKGLNKFKKITKGREKISCKDSFLLYQSYGFPIEMIEEECEKNKINFSRKEFEKECFLHQEKSRTASAGRFKSGLADNSEKTTKLHTAAHLLLAALKIVLKDNTIIQKGSNITPERIRFDFSFQRKLTSEEIKEIENLVNVQIQNSCEIIREETSPERAKAQGACGIFDKKYGKIVSVYTIGSFSKEICAGPHVKNTCELGKFKIIKQESCGSGIRRIKAILE